MSIPASISNRKLAAIFAADIAGYSALIGADEQGTVTKLNKVRHSVLPIIESFGGRIIDLAGDGILSEFGSAVRAVEAAASVQEKMKELNSETQPALQFRIGINLGDVLEDGERLYGDGINIAARLEAIAQPGEYASPPKFMTKCAARCRLDSMIGAISISRTSQRPCACFRPIDLMPIVIMD
jgi:class 3 adenylate cyclase